MKKILSLGVAAAVVSMTAVAASAAIEPTILETEAVAGQTITVEVRANDLELFDAGFVVEASENLTLVEDGAVPCDGGLFNEETNKFGWYDSEACEPGFLLLTLTYTVGEGEDVSVAISSEDYADIINAEAVTVAVVEGGDDIVDVPGDDIIVDVPGDDTTGDDTTGDDTTEDPANPDTGIALAVVPAVLAGAAIVVSKKRK